jgi:hypothetical protein
MEMTIQAQKVMEALAVRFGSAAFSDRWPWFVGSDELGGMFEELAHLGLLARAGGAGSPCHVTDTGRSWILDNRGLVVAFCPKCSTAEFVARVRSDDQVRCRVCGVRWAEDTTTEPSVSK